MNSLTLTPRSSASFLKRRLSSGETSRVTRWDLMTASVGMHMILPCACAAALSSSVEVGEKRQPAEHEEDEQDREQHQHEMQVAEDQAGNRHAVALVGFRRTPDFATRHGPANHGAYRADQGQGDPAQDPEHEAHDSHG